MISLLWVQRWLDNDTCSSICLPGYEVTKGNDIPLFDSKDFIQPSKISLSITYSREILWWSWRGSCALFDHYFRNYKRCPFSCLLRVWRCDSHSRLYRSVDFLLKKALMVQKVRIARFSCFEEQTFAFKIILRNRSHQNKERKPLFENRAMYSSKEVLKVWE